MRRVSHSQCRPLPVDHLNTAVLEAQLVCAGLNAPSDNQCIQKMQNLWLIEIKAMPKYILDVLVEFKFQPHGFCIFSINAFQSNRSGAVEV